MTDNVTIGNRFLNWFAEHYDEQKRKLKAFCDNKDYDFDEDIFQDTIIKIYNKIIKSGMLDSSEKGFDNYTFLAFKMNTMRSKEYARNMKRDKNITSDNINLVYEQWFNANKDDSRTKLIKDLFVDFSTLYIMLKVEEAFDNEHFYLFREKSLTNVTYKELQRRTQIKGVRQKILTVKAWVKDNVTKDEVNKAFQLCYGDLL